MPCINPCYMVTLHTSKILIPLINRFHTDSCCWWYSLPVRKRKKKDTRRGGMWKLLRQIYRTTTLKNQKKRSSVSWNHYYRKQYVNLRYLCWFRFWFRSTRWGKRETIILIQEKMVENCRGGYSHLTPNFFAMMGRTSSASARVSKKGRSDIRAQSEGWSNHLGIWIPLLTCNWKTCISETSRSSSSLTQMGVFAPPFALFLLSYSFQDTRVILILRQKKQMPDKIKICSRKGENTWGQLSTMVHFARSTPRIDRSFVQFPFMTMYESRYTRREDNLPLRIQHIQQLSSINTQ